MIAPNLPNERISFLQQKAAWVRTETLRIHARSPETRVASSLSPVEVLVSMYYGGLVTFDPRNPLAENRDRVIISKGHGSICMYPILADLGFFAMAELERVCKQDSFLGGIPDPVIPGYETVNGSLGHGPGVACGIALGLKRKGVPSKVYVMVGDGELSEGAVWEAIMFAGHHALDNLILIVDNNAKCMLGYSERIMDIYPLAPKFEAFGWAAWDVDGHDIPSVHAALAACGSAGPAKPRLLVANTVKGKGVPALEADPLCHIRSLKPEEIRELTGGLL